MKTGLRDILLALVDSNVSFVVAGGVAAVLHGVERLTLDLDIALDLSPENVRRFLAVMRSMHMTPRVPVPPEALMEPDKVRAMVEEKHAIVFTFADADSPLLHVDVFLKADLSFAALNQDAIVLVVDGRSIRTTSRQQLIRMKQAINPPRDKDLADIKALQRMESPTP